ncbi:hypothetical protein [Candidatus Lokiarchaeum ossiferum]|uniref:hypothetical protein n=1 Tax=Candidatus Lokiarchaeum ossiferum TaxID=2951803 RepID=UPI00352FBF10
MENYNQILQELAQAEFMHEIHEVLVKIVPNLWKWDEHISAELTKINIYEKESFYGPIEHMIGDEWKKKIEWYIKYCQPAIFPNRRVYSKYGHAIGYIEDKKYVAQCPLKFIYAKLGIA